MPEKQSWAAASRGTKSHALLTRSICGGKQAGLLGISSTLQNGAMLLTGFFAAESVFFLCQEAERRLVCIFLLTLHTRGGSALWSPELI